MAIVKVDMEIGQKINRLTLKEKFNKNGLRYGLFDCDCGKSKEMKIWFVAKEKIISCGCATIEHNRKKMTDLNTTHGLSHKLEYRTWKGIKTRCYNKESQDYKAYGGKGIFMSKSWTNSFDNFYRDMGPKPEPIELYHVGRIDHDEDYCKENCRWIDKVQESIDIDNNRSLKAYGEVKSLLKWIIDSRCKCSIENLKYRLYKLGWLPEKSLETIEYEG